MFDTRIKNKISILDNKYLVCFICISTSCLITLINQYPILYSDTSTYISSGFELQTPADRPITYGILLRLFSLNGLSFTLVPLFQALIYVYTLFNITPLFIPNGNKNFNVLLVSVLLTITTGFNWCINQLIPDFMTAIGFLNLICILFSDTKLKHNALPMLVLFISSASHISNVFLYALFLIVFLFLRKTFLPTHNLTTVKQKSAVIFILLLMSYFIMSSAISKSKSIFFSGSLAQKGILQEILKDKCSEKSFNFCRYKDSIPQSFDGFVWNANSPLYKIGGWKAAREELSQISNISLRETKYQIMQLKATSKNFTKQLVMYEIGDGNGSFKENSVLIQRIKKYSLLDKDLCINSKQYNSSFLNLNFINNYYSITFVLSLLVLVSLTLTKFKLLTKKYKFMLLLTSLFILSNFLLIAFSSEIANRHGCKLIWLIFLLNYFLFIEIKTPKTPVIHPNNH